MSKLDDKIELEAYLDDLLLHPEDHLEDPPLEIVGAFIYGIQTRNPFNVNFADYLHNIAYSEKNKSKALSNIPIKPLPHSKEPILQLCFGNYLKIKLQKKMKQEDSKKIVQSKRMISPFLTVLQID